MRVKNMDVDSKFIRKSLFRLIHLARGKSTFRNLRELEKSQWLSTEEIMRIQWVKQKNLLNYVYHHVPYYKRIFRNLKLTPTDIKTPEDFRKLPLLTKDDIEKNISQITSVEYSKRDLIKNSTGGSTGKNLRFYNDRKHSGNRDGVAIRGNRWAGLDIGVKHAYLWGSPFDISLQNNIKNRIYKKIQGGGLFLSSYDLSENNMFFYAKKLSQYKPKVVIAYSSPLYLFANFIEENKIDKINIKSIISSAEVLYEYQREKFESVFQCEVFDRYACREFGSIAHECSEHSGLHIHAEHVYLEYLTSDGNSAMPGETGELIVTDLDNYGMPFIRYRIGDIGVPSERKCNCGRGLPLMEKVEGRTFDIIIGSNGRRVGGTFWTLLLRTAVKGIDQFQVIQESSKKLNIKIVVNPQFKSEYIGILTNRIHEYLGKDLGINFGIVDEIKPSPSGKFRFVISNVSPFANQSE
jgi:phenylacetate-CoA ligase